MSAIPRRDLWMPEEEYGEIETKADPLADTKDLPAQSSETQPSEPLRLMPPEETKSDALKANLGSLAPALANLKANAPALHQTKERAPAFAPSSLAFTGRAAAILRSKILRAAEAVQLAYYHFYFLPAATKRSLYVGAAALAAVWGLSLLWVRHEAVKPFAHPAHAAHVAVSAALGNALTPSARPAAAVKKPDVNPAPSKKKTVTAARNKTERTAHSQSKSKSHHAKTAQHKSKKKTKPTRLAKAKAPRKPAAVSGTD